jgi:hypothetical protein
VLRAPSAELCHDRDQLDRRVGQALGRAPTPAGILPRKQTVLDQASHPIGEDVGGDALLGLLLQDGEMPPVTVTATTSNPQLLSGRC